MLYAAYESSPVMQQGDTITNIHLKNIKVKWVFVGTNYL